MENKFKEEDKQRIIEFLNFIAEKAQFNGLTIADNIKFFKLLNHMQMQIIPKIEANILEIKRVIQPPKEEKIKESNKNLKSKK